MNVRRNGYGDRIRVEECAIGDVDGEVDFQRSERSNRHAVLPTAGSHNFKRTPPTERDETITVRQESVGGFLAQRGVDPTDVSVVRMDLEGYEASVFAGMEPILRAAGPTVIYVELHPVYVEDEAMDRLLSLLEGHDFAIVSVVRDVYGQQFRWHGERHRIGSYAALRRLMAETDAAIELVVRK